MQQKGASLAELTRPFQSFPQLLENLRVAEKRPLEECAHVQKAVSKAEATLGSGGRIVLRYSGTEPLLRVMLEGPTQDLIQSLAEDILQAARMDLEAIDL